MNTYLKSLKLQGYRTIRNAVVDFSPGLNVIIGKNGSGKTNFMTFLHNCLTFDYTGLSSFDSKLDFSGDKEFSISANRNLSNLSAEDFLSELLLNNKVSMLLTSENGQIKYEDVSELSKDIKEQGSFSNVQFIRHGVDYKRFSHAISTPLSFDIDISKEGSVTSSELFEYYSKSQGSSFSSALFIHLLIDIIIQKYTIEEDVQKTFTTRIEAIFKLFCDILNKDISKYLPIESVRLNPAFKVYRDEEKNLVKFQGLIFDFKFSGDWLPFSSLSDGTKRLFYLYAEICIVPQYHFAHAESRPHNNIILVEEPELGIHPHQFHLVMDFLKEVSTINQVIITTHSPQALDMINEDELGTINISSFNSKEGTTIKKLTSDQKSKAKKYMAEMFLSDYWVHSNLEDRK